MLKDSKEINAYVSKVYPQIASIEFHEKGAEELHEFSWGYVDDPYHMHLNKDICDYENREVVVLHLLGHMSTYRKRGWEKSEYDAWVWALAYASDKKRLTSQMQKEIIKIRDAYVKKPGYRYKQHVKALNRILSEYFN